MLCALGVAVAEEDEFLLLPGPKAADTFSVHLQRGEDMQRKVDGGAERGGGYRLLGLDLWPLCFGLKLS